jgi:hypothetical protein
MELFKLFGTILIDNDKANKSLSATEKQGQSTSDKLGTAFKKLGGILVTAFSVQKIMEFSSACIDAYKIQTEAETKLETVMRQRMGATDESIQSVKDYASALQNVGVVGDEVQLAGAQQLATFLNTDEALKTLMPAMANLAVQQNGVNVTSQNMVSIGNMVGKVMQGQTSALTRVGITFDQAQEKMLKYGTEQERASVLAEIITQNVGNMNEVMAQTDDGKMQQAKNTLGDIQEVIGERLIPVQTAYYQTLASLATLLADYIIPFVDNCISSFNNFKASLNENSIIVQTLNELWQTYGIPIFQTISSMVQTVKATWDLVFPSIQESFSVIMQALFDIWASIGSVVFDYIVIAVNTVGDIFNYVFPIVAQVVSDAFTLISQVYTNIFKPVIDIIVSVLQTYLLPIVQFVFQKFSDKVKETFDFIQMAWNTILYPCLSWIIAFLGNVFKGDIDAIFNQIKTLISTIWQSIKDFLAQKVDEMYNKVIGVFESAKAKVQEIWNAIKDAIITPITNAKDKVVELVDKIVDKVTNFSWSLPPLKLPHVSISGEWSLKPPSAPHFSIDWYKKAMDNPMILNGATIFGAQGDKLLGGGEAGTEVVSGADTLMSMISQAVNNGTNNDILATLKSILATLTDEDKIHEVIVKALTDGNFAVVLDNREVGRIVRKYA